MRILFAALAMTALGCASAAPEPVRHAECIDAEGVATFHLDPGAAEAIGPLVPTVAASWARFSGHEGTFHVDDVASSTCTIRFAPASEAPGLMGLYDRGSDGDIVLIPEAMGRCEGSAEAGPCYSMVLLHELGHAFGMNHTPRGLMAKDGGPFFTREDRAECLRVGACEPDASWLPTDER